MNNEVSPTASGLRNWGGFVIMCLGMFMAILDIQIVATSLPAIQHALGIAPDQMVWIQTAYLTAEIVAIPLTGYLTARLGIRWLFVGAVSLFTIASAACGQSQSFETLVAWRIVQGFAGGTLIPAVFSAVFLMFPLRSQGLAGCVYSTAGPAHLGAGDVGTALDHADYRFAWRASADRRSLSVSASPQLLRRGRRDCGPAAGLWPDFYRSPIYGAKCRNAVGPDRRRGPRLVRRGRSARGGGHVSRLFGFESRALCFYPQHCRVAHGRSLLDLNDHARFHLLPTETAHF
jgi:hypothetical protein